MPREEVEELLRIVDHIARLERRMRDISWQIREIRNKIDPLVARIELDIATATDEEGKRTYSNERMRRAEQTLRLEKHDEYRSLKQRLMGLGDEKGDVYIEHNRLTQQRNILMLAMGADTSSTPISPPDDIM